METKTKAHINWDERKIVGSSGREYKIVPELLSSARWVEFELRAMTQAYKANIDGMVTLHDEVINTLKNGPHNCSGNTHEALIKLEGFRRNLVNSALFRVTESIEFCSLFCIYDGEDVSTWSEELVRSKWEDWKEIPNEDFFLLSIKVKISLSKRYEEKLRIEQEELISLHNQA